MVGNILIAWICSYFIGAIPFGFLVVWVLKGKDVRKIESGRTGGTNVMRAAGVFAGILTAFLDIMKGVATRWIVLAFVPDSLPWVQVLAALLAVIGHNYSIFLMEKRADGKIVFRGGAGGATAFGGAIAIWPQAVFYIFPIGLFVFLFIGYASVTTISISLVATVLFAIRAISGLSSWVYVAYGIMSLGLVMWALRPNLKRLKEGTERLTGLRAYWMNKIKKKTSTVG